jgi:hypothetical protein
MTPKEKAKELIDKFIPLCGIEMTEIQCSLIAVDEIINERCAPFIMADSRYNYWQEVKKEIENL